MITRSALLAVLLLTQSAHADVALPGIFGDHMVLQSDIQLPVWGTAAPGEEVSVSVAGREAKTTAGPDGKWRVTLDPIAASATPVIMSVTGKNSLAFQDVLIGEVWLCSGQSNMALALKNAAKGAEVIATATIPQMRLYTVPRVAGVFEPQADVKGQWVVCSPETVSDFSAVAFFFGRDILAATKHPVGLINSSFGGTPVQAWTSEQSLLSQPEFTGMAASSRNTQKKLPQLKEEWDTKILPAYESAQKAWDEENARLLAAWETTAAAARAAGQPEPPKPAPASKAPVRPRYAGEFKGMPFCLYNAMINPLIPYAIKGVIWYQGEANARTEQAADAYSRLFPLMINDWRARWGQGDFPFLFVQLPGLERQEAWPFLRHAQLKTLSLPKTGMAVAIDLGNPNDIHPTNKLPVGQRLALAARGIAYGEDLVYSGPLYDSLKIEDGRIRLSFRHIGGGLIAGQPASPAALKGFTIAGADHKFVPAQAVIDGDTVVVSSPEVAAPIAVRYDWANYPDGNLSNKEALPASPFATDVTFPLPAATPAAPPAAG